MAAPVVPEVYWIWATSPGTDLGQPSGRRAAGRGQLLDRQQVAQLGKLGRQLVEQATDRMAPVVGLEHHTGDARLGQDVAGLGGHETPG